MPLKLNPCRAIRPEYRMCVERSMGGIGSIHDIGGLTHFDP